MILHRETFWKAVLVVISSILGQFLGLVMHSNARIYAYIYAKYIMLNLDYNKAGFHIII